MREWIHLVSWMLSVVTLSAGHAAAGEESPRIETDQTSQVFDASAPRESRSDQLESWHSGNAADLAGRLREQLAQAASSVEAISDIQLASFEQAQIKKSEAAATPIPAAAGNKATATDVEKPAVTVDAASSDSIPEWAGSEPPAALDLGDLLGRLGIATGIVLAIAVVSVLAIRKWMGPAVGLRPTSTQRLRHVESLALPMRASIQLVELDGKPILIGMNAAGLQTITPVERSFAESLNSLNEEDATEKSSAGEPMTEMASTEDRTKSESDTAAASWTDKAAVFLSSHLTPARST